MPDAQPTILCLASAYKGGAFLQEAHRQGCGVLLLTREKFADEPWPMESIDERFLMADLAKRPDIFNGVSYLARSRRIGQIIPLDDYDVETAAALREHLRLSGMGDSVIRFFRDKLAMRLGAEAGGIPVPAFTGVFNDDAVRGFMERVPPPWVLKPRSEAGSMGIRKMHSAEQVWARLGELGDERSYFLLEQFIPGDVFHVDSIFWNGEVAFSLVSRYARPLLSITTEGGVFITRTVDRASPEAVELRALHARVLGALHMQNGVNHAEYIQGEGGKFHFLEIAARVGGANIAETVEFASGLNLWAEWARLVACELRGEAYRLPPVKQEYAGVLICLARQEHPDLTPYNDPEIMWRLDKKHHAGLIVASPQAARVQELLDAYSGRFAGDFMAVLPPKDKLED